MDFLSMLYNFNSPCSFAIVAMFYIWLSIRVILNTSIR